MAVQSVTAAANASRWADTLNRKKVIVENELLEAAKELLNDFDLYGNPIQLRVIAKLRRATEAAQQKHAMDSATPCAVCGSTNGKHYGKLGNLLETPNH